MPGPLPATTRRRTNAPTIPTTVLPAAGFEGTVPDVPPGAELGTVGRLWWDWAWETPQAAGWSPGHEAMVARRASLEDDLDALERVKGLDFLDVLDAEEAAAAKAAISRIAASATGRLQILREMREMDDRLGLTPKGMAALRWTIDTKSAPAASATTTDGNVVTPTPDRWKRTAG